MASRVSPKAIWVAPLHRPSQKTPCLVQTRWLYLVYEPSYRWFCVKVATPIWPKISLCSPRVRSKIPIFASEERICLALIRESCLADSRPTWSGITKVTDGRTDDMRWQCRGLHLSASRGKSKANKKSTPIHSRRKGWSVKLSTGSATYWAIWHCCGR